MQDKQNQFDDQQSGSQAIFRQPGSSLEGTEASASPASECLPRQSSVFLSEAVERRGQNIACWVGYSLLLFGLFDYLHIVIPPQFTNPTWEFQTIGALVEHIAAPLLGLMLVFYRQQGYIKGLERKFLGCLSWVSLLLGVLYLLMLPLGVADTWRIYNANKAEIAAQVSQRSQPLQQIKVNLDKAKTDEQLQQVFASLTPQNRIPQVKQPQLVKDKLLTEISQSQRNIQTQANALRASQKQALLKNSLKWNLGALVAGTLFIVIWRLTDWTRVG